MKRVIFAFCCFIFSLVVVNAECDLNLIKDLKKEASNISTDVTINDKDGNDSNITIVISNITDKLYLEVTNSTNDSKLVINYSNTLNGKYAIRVKDLYTQAIFNIKVYSKSCDNTLLFELTVKKPFFNVLSTYGDCVNNSDVPICQKYVTTRPSILPSMIYNYIEQYRKEEEKKKDYTTQIKSTSTTSNVVEKKSNNVVLYFIIPIVGVLALGGTAVYLIQKRRSSI